MDIPETASLLGKSASSFFDSLASQVGDGLNKIHKDTTNVANSAGKTMGVVKEDGSVSLFAPSEEDPILKHMTKKQRIVGFLGCIMMGLFCFSFAAALLPVLVVSSRKFALWNGGRKYSVFDSFFFWKSIDSLGATQSFTIFQCLH